MLAWKILHDIRPISWKFFHLLPLLAGYDSNRNCFREMTILATMLNTEFALSVTDRRSVVQRGDKFKPIDEKFNKHIMFAFGNVKGAATYTGLAKWKRRSGEYVSTEQIIGNSLSIAAKSGSKLGSALYRIALSLTEELDGIRSIVQPDSQLFTVVMAGFSNLFAEPWISIVTDQKEVPIWADGDRQIEIPAPEPFRIHFAVPSEPFTYLAGYTKALPRGTQKDLETLLSVPGVQAYNVANLAVSRIRGASLNSSAIGSRASAIVFPAHGWVDTGLWGNAKEPLAAAMPRIVYSDGRQWEPSEMKLEFQNCAISRLQKHSLLYQTFLVNRVSVRSKRRIKRIKSGDLVAPTIYQLLWLLLYAN